MLRRPTATRGGKGREWGEGVRIEGVRPIKDVVVVGGGGVGDAPLKDGGAGALLVFFVVFFLSFFRFESPRRARLPLATIPVPAAGHEARGGTTVAQHRCAVPHDLLQVNVPLATAGWSRSHANSNATMRVANRGEMDGETRPRFARGVARRD